MMTVSHYCGEGVTWEVTVSDTLAQSYVHEMSQTPGAAAERRTNKYSSLTQSYMFVPVAAETVGAIKKDGMDFLNDLGRRITQSTYDHRETVAPEWIWKLGDTGPAQKWGDWSGAKRRNFFCGRAPPLFLALKVQLVVLMSAFLMVSTVWSVSCLLFFYARCIPRVQQFVKVGARAPPVPHGVGATPARAPSSFSDSLF